MIRISNSDHTNIGSGYVGPIKAVIFDWAGTVVDYGSRAPVEAVMRVFANSGVPISTEEARGPMGMAKRDHIAAVLALPRVRQEWKSVYSSDPDESTVDCVYQTFLATQTDLLCEYAELIPGCLEAVEDCRGRGMKIGSSTGYTRELMDVLEPVVHRQGFKPDVMICASDVPQGRPAPWMCLENARRLDVFPMASIVVVDDTTVGIEAGLNAGMRTIGIAMSGNLVGLSEGEFSNLSTAEQQDRLQAACEQLAASGADVVIDTVEELIDAIDALEQGSRDSITAATSRARRPSVSR